MNNKSIKILIGLSIFVVFCLSLNLASASYNVATDRGYAVYSDEDKPLYQVVYKTSDVSGTSSYHYADSNSSKDQCFISSFSASDTSVNAGDGVRLRWITDDCDYVSITSIGNVADSGSYYVYPQGDTVYRITAYNSNSNKYTKTISIKVQEEEKIAIANNASGNTSTVGTNGSDGYVNKPVLSNTTQTPIKNTISAITNPKIPTNSKTNVNTSDEKNNTKTENDGVYGGAVDVTGNGLTALSMGGSDSFMPSSIWQWILVVFLILVAIILFRIVIKTAPKNNHAHA